MIEQIAGGSGGIRASARSNAAQRSSDYYGGQPITLEGIDYNQTDTMSVLLIAAAVLGGLYLVTR